MGGGTTRSAFPDRITLQVPSATLPSSTHEGSPDMATTRSVEGLRSTISGALITPGDPGYDTARSLWNGAFDRHPAAIACCSSPADVAAAIGFAEANGLEISVRGGAHSFSGASA